MSLAAVAALAAVGALLFQDDFESGLDQWKVETELPSKITAQRGVLDIEAPAGATLWFRPELKGPVAIVFDATAVAEGGRHDRVSDLNCFWMARNNDGTTPVYARARGGKFAEYNDLLAYYVGLGGNGNTTTRFRRYIGDRELRPLLPQHDLSAPDTLLKPNRRQTITIIADGEHVRYLRDDQLLFEHHDEQPYTSGWFGLRTTRSHLRIEELRIYALVPLATKQARVRRRRSSLRPLAQQEEG